MFTCESCGLEQIAKMAPCPDGREGCGTDNQPDWENTTFIEKVGPAIINAEAVKKLRIS